LVTPVLEPRQMELVDVELQHEHGQWILRFYIDNTGGITLDDCGEMSDQISTVLDAADPIPQAYSLEVSSPGVYRHLRKEKDYLKYVGERVEIALFTPQDGRRHFKGTIDSVSNDSVSIRDEKNVFSFPFISIAKANLDPDVNI